MPRADGARRGLIGRAVALAFAAGVVLAASPARADTHVEASISAFSSPTFVDRSMHVATGSDSIDMLDKNDVRLVGNGTFSGGALRAVVRCDRLRIGLEEALFVGSGFDVRSGALPSGFSATNGSIWGGRFELSIGRDLVAEDAPTDAITPYVDLRLGLSLVTTNLQLHSAQWGGLGDSSYGIVAPFFAPRLGVRVPLGEAGFLDLNGSYAIFGLERATLGAGLGVQL